MDYISSRVKAQQQKIIINEAKALIPESHLKGEISEAIRAQIK